METSIPDRLTGPPSLMHLSPSERIELWFELVDESEALLRAGLRAQMGPNDVFEDVYRQWCERRMEQHDRDQRRFLENLSRLEARAAAFPD